MIVSVVTVTKDIVKNGGKSKLIRCIDSVSKQILKHGRQIEHIFIDGGSADGTVDIITAHSSGKYKCLVVSEPDTGIYDAMNKGINYATGDFVVFLNADDYFNDVNSVDLSVDALESSGADISYGYWRLETESNLSHIRTAELGLFFIRMPFCHQTMLTKRRKLLEIGGFDSLNFRSAGDFDLVLRLLLNGCSCVEVPYVIVHFSFGGMSSNTELSNNEVIYSMLKNLKYLQNFEENEVRKMFYEMSFPVRLFNLIQKRVDFTVLDAMNTLIKRCVKRFDRYYFVDVLNSRYFNNIPEFGSNGVVRFIRDVQLNCYRRIANTKKIRRIIGRLRKQLYLLGKVADVREYDKYLVLGREYFLNCDTPSFKFLNFGEVENFGRWMLGGISLIEFRLYKPLDVVVTMTCDPYLTNFQKDLSLVVYVNRKINSKFEFFTRKQRDISFVIDASDFDVEGKVEISFESNSRVSPSAEFGDEDRRNLAFAISKITVFPCK